MFLLLVIGGEGFLLEGYVWIIVWGFGRVYGVSDGFK